MLPDSFPSGVFEDTPLYQGSLIQWADRQGNPERNIHFAGKLKARVKVQVPGKENESSADAARLEN